MSNVKSTKIKDNVYGNLMQLSNGIVELKVSLDFGPRILHYSLVGKENMFYNDTEKKVLDVPFPEFNNEQSVLYGGHRVWVAPENLPTCYHPDNEPVEYYEKNGKFYFVAPIEKYINIQKSIIIELSEDSSAVYISNEIKNCSGWDIELATWAITMMDINGMEIIPQADRATGVLSNRNFTFWEYSNMADERVYFGKDFITLKQDKNNSQPFKLGFNNEHGWAAYANKGQIFFKFHNHIEDEQYPDNGCSYETYTNNCMLEMESLSPLQLLGVGEISIQEETWELYEQDSSIRDMNENELKTIVNKYIK